ncbi:PAS domain-containing sensor histidine kinase [Geothrix sp. 21YS21S-2]|uniref:PAS domain-containing sensor histidine kinase n=1 Tax=Geothrix sp. 21YS21S-2 TaxID=3068893 RepID=UPI0027BA90A7|nr:PAS domain-containing sensor histidine kinase [Geothrix sp. 21YS21S-2]
MPFLALVIGLLLGAALAGLALARRRAPAEPAGIPAVLERCAMGAVLIRDRKVVWANARCAGLLGADAESLAGVDTRGWHQDDAAFEQFGRVIEGFAEPGSAFRGEVRLRRVDGSPFWAYLVGGPVAPGRPEQGVLWFLEDVSDRVEAQMDLSEVLSLNQKLIAASPMGIMLYRDADGACVLTNEAAARILNGSPGEILKQNFRRLKSWKESGLREAADRALATGADQTVEAHFTSSFGKEVWIVAHLVPFTSRGERLLLLLGDDVSEKIEATRALRASEEKYRVVVETLNEGLALVDSSGALTFCNQRLAEMGGYAPGEMLGRHYSAFVPEAHLPFLTAKAILQQPAASETFEVGLRRRDGSDLDARVSLASVHDAQGAISALAILVTDISIRKRVERERERLMAELEQKNKELETLLYVASHDLRSPLVNIQGFSQRLARSLEELRKAQEGAGSLEAFAEAARPHLQERMPSSLEFIRASGIRMDAIINGLLTLSRAGRMVLRTGPLDMNAVLASCSKTLAYQFESAEGALQVEDLPPCRADSAQATQIVSNLLDNAVKYRHGDRPLRVRVSGRVAGESCEYCVEDNGVGISGEHQERIWEIFQRLDPQGPVPGEGLGLTLVRRMAERNGGRVRVESTPGEGSRFFLELPRG